MKPKSTLHHSYTNNALGKAVHPDAPTGGGGRGRFVEGRPSGSGSSADQTLLPHPRSPAGRRLTPEQISAADGRLTGCGYVGVFDQKPERGEMIAGRIREELERPLDYSIKNFFRVKVFPREASVSDVQSLRDHDVVVAVLGKGGEEPAMKLFEASAQRFHKRLNIASAKAETKRRFSVLGGGITVPRVAVVPVAAASPFGGDETLIGNVGVHEFGHAISELGIERDHGTGGVMQPEIGTDQPALHFTAEFLKQF